MVVFSGAGVVIEAAGVARRAIGLVDELPRRSAELGRVVAEQADRITGQRDWGDLSWSSNLRMMLLEPGAL